MHTSILLIRPSKKFCRYQAEKWKSYANSICLNGSKGPLTKLVSKIHFKNSIPSLSTLFQEEKVDSAECRKLSIIFKIALVFTTYNFTIFIGQNRLIFYSFLACQWNQTRHKLMSIFLINLINTWFEHVHYCNDKL